MGASNVKWVRLGDYIEQCDERNSASVNYPVIGINRDKTFMPTVANLDGVDIAKYKIVTKGMFVFSGMQTGRDICIRIGLYDNEQPALVSPAYTTFVINDDKKVLPEYFFMYFNRAESDRYGWFISDSSVRANLDWPRFLDIEFPLPSPDEQQKMVNVWKAFREIKEQNEAKAAPLMQVCQSYIQELKHKYPMQEIGPYIEEYDEIIRASYQLGAVKDELKLTLLQRDFIKRVGQYQLRVFLEEDSKNKETLEWFLNNEEALRLWTIGGRPNGSYERALQVLSDLYHTYKEDLENENVTSLGTKYKDLYLKMMLL